MHSDVSLRKSFLAPIVSSQGKGPKAAGQPRREAPGSLSEDQHRRGKEGHWGQPMFWPRAAVPSLGTGGPRGGDQEWDSLSIISLDGDVLTCPVPHQALRGWYRPRTPCCQPTQHALLCAPSSWHIIGGEKCLLNACMNAFISEYKTESNFKVLRDLLQDKIILHQTIKEQHKIEHN